METLQLLSWRQWRLLQLLGTSHACCMGTYVCTVLSPRRRRQQFHAAHITARARDYAQVVREDEEGSRRGEEGLFLPALPESPPPFLAMFIQYSYCYARRA